MKSKRNSSFEVLRIIAMLFIICSHASVKGGFGDIEDISFWNRVILDFFVLGNLGVAIFVMITGYFNISSDFRIKKILSLWIHVLIYSVLFLIVHAVSTKGVSAEDIRKCIFPVWFGDYSFFRMYFILYIFSPFLNKALNNLDNKQFTVLVILMFILWSAIPTLLTRDICGSELARFVMYYSIGAYIKRMLPDIKVKTRWLLMFMGMLFVSLFAAAVLSNISGSMFENRADYFFTQRSMLIVMLAATLIVIFSKIDIGKIDWVNMISKTTFGIYLIHCNTYTKEWIWQDVLDSRKYTGHYSLGLRLLLNTLLVFIVCSLIEYVRSRVFDKITDKGLDLILTRFSKK